MEVDFEGAAIGTSELHALSSASEREQSRRGGPVDIEEEEKLLPVEPKERMQRRH